MLSTYTAFFIVKENNQPVEGTMVSRDINKKLKGPWLEENNMIITSRMPIIKNSVTGGSQKESPVALYV